MTKFSPPSTRVVDQDVAIIGAGFAGIGMAIRLMKAGMTDFSVFEQATSVGGTWRDNTYPGAACDVQSHLYSFSFEPNPNWSSMYGRQEEILAYLEYCTDRYDIEGHIRFDTAVRGAHFDSAVGIWTLEIDDGTTSTARAIVIGTGGLSRPQLPDVDGLQDFVGPVFHSARWNHGCDLAGKRVAVVGTGASAIQIAPQVARIARKLTLFQRSAAWVLPKPDRTIGPREQRLFERLPLAQRLYRLRLYWTLELRVLAFVRYPQVMNRLQKRVEAYLAEIIEDADLRATLTPDYTLGCKRVLLANDYYPALQRDNVEVVPRGIESLTVGGLCDSAGVEHPADAIVFCTGFKAADDVAPFPVTGLHGVGLAESWQSGAEAYLGTTVSGFPNMFVLAGPNTALGHSSMVFILESQMNYVMSCLRAMRRGGLRYMDVRSDVQSRFNQDLQSRMAGTIWTSGCSSWYQARDGKITTLWPGSTIEYRLRTLRVNPRDYNCVKV